MRETRAEVVVPCVGKLLGEYGMIATARRALDDARLKMMPAGSKARWKEDTTCHYMGTRRGKGGSVELVYQVCRVTARGV